MDWGTDCAETRQLVAQLNLQSKVVWEPLCSKPMLRKRQRAADLVADQFVMAGYGTSVLESMAAGKLVVMAWVETGRSVALSEAPPLLAARDEDQILAALLRAADDGFRSARGEESLRWVRANHGFEAVAPRSLRGLKAAMGIEE